jgi:hypothetical protein
MREAFMVTLQLGLRIKKEKIMKYSNCYYSTYSDFWMQNSLETL